MAENFKSDYDDGMDSSFSIPFGQQGHPTSPMTPAQIREFGLRLNAGLKNVEAGPLQTQTFETIPKQHFDEMRRLAKLADAHPSFHAPLVDPAGFQQGNYGEGNRITAEEQLKTVVERAHKMDPGTGEPIRINAHSSNDAMAYGFVKDEKLKDKNYVQSMGIVNQENGQSGPIGVQEAYAGEQIEGVEKYKHPADIIKDYNEETWDQTKLQLRSKEYERDIIKERIAAVKQAYDQAPRDHPQFNELAQTYSSLKAEERAQEENKLFQAKAAFEKYLKYFTPETRNQKEQYSYLRNNYADLIKRYDQQRTVEKQERERLREQLRKASDTSEKLRLRDEAEQRIRQATKVTSDEFIDLIDVTEAPQIYKPVEEFALDKSAETFANVGLHSIGLEKGNYKKAPVVTIENFMPETPFSRGKSLRKLVEESRKKLAEKLIKERKFTQTEANKAAEAVIGATWDVGHIYQLKKHGFTEKDVIKDTEEIAPVVKHMHLTDNFGYADSHLPIGMGSVPIKEMVEKVQKAGYKGKYIIEAGAFAGEFKADPAVPSAEYLNSPLYTYDKSINWGQARDMYQTYSQGMGDILPDTHFRQLYGGGFSQLPTELGGQSGGGRSRFSGDPLT